MSVKNLKSELEDLVKEGRDIAIAILVQYQPEAIKGKAQLPRDYYDEVKTMTLNRAYQLWYSKALVVIQQLLPSRVEDFKSYYEYPSKRKDMTLGNYRVADALRGHILTKESPYGGRHEIAGWGNCYLLVDAQCTILESAKAYFDSSILQIQQVLQADLFDSEIDAARELNKKGFCRAAGAMAGVVLERHFATVAKVHSVTSLKKNPCINDYNQTFKDGGIIDVPTWRFIQRLGDLRNMCDHAKCVEPKKEDIEELIVGVDKIMKTVV